MNRFAILIFALFIPLFGAFAQAPLYIVNGTRVTDIASIPPDDIENVESLPADEQTIARYGTEASNGVLLVTLRYDQSATFKADTTFESYIARQVKWDADEPAARVILRYTITPEGTTVIDKTLESTDSRLKRRILKAVAEAPNWSPATKNGNAIASEGVLNLQLPHGKPMPRQVVSVWR